MIVCLHGGDTNQTNNLSLSSLPNNTILPCPCHCFLLYFRDNPGRDRMVVGIRTQFMARCTRYNLK